MKSTIAAREAAIAKKSIRSTPKPPTRYKNVQSASGKPTRGLPFAIVSQLTGKPVVEGHLVIVPDDAVNDLIAISAAYREKREAPITNSSPQGGKAA
jgi:hypothetical protein